MNMFVTAVLVTWLYYSAAAAAGEIIARIINRRATRR